MHVREETAQDLAAIARLIELAFGQAGEARLVDQLRADGDATVSLVAVEAGRVFGHVMLSPMSAPFRALGLAPLAVLPEFQRRGIGTALMSAAIERARQGKWPAIFVVGDPDYYGPFGFRADLAAGFASPYAGPYLMVLPLNGLLPANTGRIDYAPAFGGLA